MSNTKKMIATRKRRSPYICGEQLGEQPNTPRTKIARIDVLVAKLKSLSADKQDLIVKPLTFKKYFDNANGSACKTTPPTFKMHKTLPKTQLPAHQVPRIREQLKTQVPAQQVPTIPEQLKLIAPQEKTQVPTTALRQVQPLSNKSCPWIPQCYRQMKSKTCVAPQEKRKRGSLISPIKPNNYIDLTNVAPQEKRPVPIIRQQAKPSDSKRSSPQSYRPMEFKSSIGSNHYTEISVKTNTEIQFNLSKGQKSFLFQNDINGQYYLFDSETMQQHNINTGYRRSVRFKKQELSNMNNGDFDILDSFGVFHEIEDNLIKQSAMQLEEDEEGDEQVELQQQEQEQQPVDICCAAFENEWICGEISNQKLMRIRQLQSQRSPLVNEMLQLSEEYQLFDPSPISPTDSRFPMEQIKHLNYGGLSVHSVRPTRMWKRNRRHFDLLHEEETDIFSMYKRGDQPVKLTHFGWHGAPAHNIKGILECGFLSAPTARVGRCYGHGVYIATEKNASYSRRDRFSVPDAAGFKYMLLCELLPGTVEVSRKDQTHPRNPLSHSGVDRMPNPTMHVFYTYDMNVRISPKFVVCIHPEVPQEVLTQMQSEWDESMYHDLVS